MTTSTDSAAPAQNFSHFKNSRGEAVRWTVVAAEYRQAIQLAPGAFHPNTTSCERCGQCIKWVATLQSSDGQTLRTGFDCAEALEGGPDHRALRRAQNAWLYAERERLTAGERAQRREEVAASKRALAAHNATEHAVLLAGLAEILGSEKAGEFEIRVLGRIATDLTTGERGHDLAEWERPIYDRALRTARLPASKHFGKVGERNKKDGIPVTFDGVHHFESAFGMKSVYRFRTDCGAVLVWFTTSGLPDQIPGSAAKEAVGARFLLWGTVKAHGEWRGTAQTEVQRVKVSWVDSGHFYTMDPKQADPRQRFSSITWARSAADLQAEYPDHMVAGPFPTYSAAQESLWAAYDAAAEPAQAAA